MKEKDQKWDKNSVRSEKKKEYLSDKWNQLVLPHGQTHPCFDHEVHIICHMLLVYV